MILTEKKLTKRYTQLLADEKKMLDILTAFGLREEGVKEAKPPPQASRYVGDSITRHYHKLSCHLIVEIKPENMVWFSSPTDAIVEGYEPCKLCNPDLEQ